MVNLEEMINYIDQVKRPTTQAQQKSNDFEKAVLNSSALKDYENT